jgi:hypothetical protein
MPEGRYTGVLEECMTNDFPDGDAHLAWRTLDKKLAPKNKSNKESLKEAFNDSTKLKRTDDPEEYIDNLLDIRRRLKPDHGCDLDDDDIIDQTLKVLPDPYDYVIDMIRDKRNNGSFHLDQLITILNDKFERIIIKG